MAMSSFGKRKSSGSYAGPYRKRKPTGDAAARTIQRAWRAKRYSKRDVTISRPAPSPAKGTNTLNFAVRDLGVSATGRLLYTFGRYIEPGSAENNRIGNEILPTNLMIKWKWEGGDIYNIVRLIVIQALRPSTSEHTQESIGDYLDLTGTAGDIASLSFARSDRKMDFNVLYDKCTTVGWPVEHLLDTDYEPTTEPLVRWATINISGKRMMPIRYNSDGSEIVNDIMIYAISDSTTVVEGGNPDIDLVGRLHYRSI